MTPIHTFSALNFAISNIIRSLNFAKISYILFDVYGIKSTEVRNSHIRQMGTGGYLSDFVHFWDNGILLPVKGFFGSRD